MTKIYEFGTAPQATSEGYAFKGVVHSTAHELLEKHKDEDLIFVTGCALHGDPSRFEFARFEQKTNGLPKKQPSSKLEKDDQP